LTEQAITGAPDRALISLAEHEAEIAKALLRAEHSIFEVCRLIDEIEQAELWKAGGFASMTEYYPALLAKMRQAGRLGVGERTVRGWMRIYKVFVQNLQIEPERILTLGTSHFNYIAEALDYDRRTGVVADTPRPGKIGKEGAVAMIEDLEARQRDGLEWRVQDTQESLNLERGVKPRRIELQWASSSKGATLKDIIVWDDTEAVRPREGCSPALALWLSKKMGAIHNLSED
jgi:hypothetical protein